MICTPAERDLIVAGATRLVVAGDPVHYDGLENAWVDVDHVGPVRRPDLDHVGVEDRKSRFVAPQRWVDATGPCPTCDGGKLNWALVGTPFRCPDCIGGRKREALQVECPVCEMRLRFWPNADKEYGNQHEHCRGTGLITFAYATVEVLPVLPNAGAEQPATELFAHYTHAGIEVVRDGTAIGLLPCLDHDPRGRDWVVLLDNVELAT